VPIFGLMWILELLSNKKISNFWWGSLGGVAAFWLVMLPLVLFDFKHNFLNYRAMTELFTNHQSVGFNLLETLGKVPNIFFHDLIGRYLGAENVILAFLVSTLALLPIILRIKKSWPVLLLTVWLSVGLIGLSFYQGNIYDHYLGFLNPVPYLLLGASFTIFKFKPKTFYIIGWLILIVALSLVNFSRNPLLKNPNYQLTRTQEVAKFIIAKTNEQPFNFALIAKSNYDSAYQFYLGQYGHKPLQVPFDITGQLFVVCEDPVCDPTHSSKYEVAGFGWSKIESEQDFYGVKIYKLIANPSGKP